MWLREKESNLHLRIQSPACCQLHYPAIEFESWSRWKESNLRLSIIDRALFHWATPRWSTRQDSNLHFTA